MSSKIVTQIGKLALPTQDSISLSVKGEGSGVQGSVAIDRCKCIFRVGEMKKIITQNWYSIFHKAG